MNSLDNASKNKPARDSKGRLLPGNTANPDGRPPGSLSLLSLLKSSLESVPKGQKRNQAERIIENIINNAIKGDFASQKLIWNYVEGMPANFKNSDSSIEDFHEGVIFLPPKKDRDEVIYV